MQALQKEIIVVALQLHVLQRRQVQCILPLHLQIVQHSTVCACVHAACADSMQPVKALLEPVN